MSKSDVIVFGGYGTFGTHVARDLATSGLHVTIAGRNRARAEGAALTLGDSHCGIAADLAEFASCRDALNGQCVAVNAAGPFSSFETMLLDACLDAGCHNVDIADDRDYVSRVRARTSEFAAAGLTAAYGCSSLPGISGALATVLCEQVSNSVDHVRITLFIGNRNRKGLGAVQSAAETIGQPIEAPQGVLVGFGESERVPLYPPFGSRRTLNFNSPDYDLLPGLVPVRSVSVKAGLELPGLTAAFGISARCFPRLGRWLIPRLVPCSGLLGWIGSSGGQVMVEFFSNGAKVHRAAMIAHSDGQRLAALPAVYVTRQLCDNDLAIRGAVTAYEAIGAQNLIDAFVADGFEYQTDG
ncbi:MAG: saccharopine dehydrogenase NADP-binding domain-containing protein [Pirellulaceae bacterium]|nr:saccharopine dehydrogenase NADP-binding domain-containing protein [Pirellulaceae bacterium]